MNDKTTESNWQIDGFAATGRNENKTEAFRPMRRSKQALAEEEIREVLRTSKRLAAYGRALRPARDRVMVQHHFGAVYPKGEFHVKQIDRIRAIAAHFGK